MNRVSNRKGFQVCLEFWNHWVQVIFVDQQNVLRTRVDQHLLAETQRWLSEARMGALAKDVPTANMNHQGIDG